MIDLYRRGTQTLLAPLALLLVLSCGEERDGDDGNGAAQLPNCPAVAAVADESCEDIYATCTYMDCEGAGVTTATCRTDKLWDVTERPCNETHCAGDVCAPGEICVVLGSGYPRPSCVENTCGTGPIGCECPGCPAEATGCTSYGLGVECNMCNAEICP